MLRPSAVLAIKPHTAVFALAFFAAACGSNEPAREPVAAAAQVAAPVPAAPAPPPAPRAPKLVDVPVPKLSARINDYANILPKSDVTRLEFKLAEHERATGQQFALLTVPTLSGVDAADFGFTVAQRWKLGRKDHDDGLLVLIALDEHQTDIEVGIGLTPVISDELAASVIREQIGPAFREQKYGAGLNDAFNRLIAAARPRDSAKP